MCSTKVFNVLSKCAMSKTIQLNSYLFKTLAQNTNKLRYKSCRQLMHQLTVFYFTQSYQYKTQTKMLKYSFGEILE